MQSLRTRFSRVHKANIPPNDRRAFEQAGPEVIRALMGLGQINPSDLPGPLTQLSSPQSVERQNAFAWLNEKAHRAEKKERRMAAVE